MQLHLLFGLHAIAFTVWFACNCIFCLVRMQLHFFAWFACSCIYCLVCMQLHLLFGLYAIALFTCFVSNPMFIIGFVCNCIRAVVFVFECIYEAMILSKMHYLSRRWSAFNT